MQINQFTVSKVSFAIYLLMYFVQNCQCSIYVVLDDPLSAVDAVVAKEIFENCIKTHLKDKTVLLITSGIQV